jgi:hypothetical protein
VLLDHFSEMWKTTDKLTAQSNDFSIVALVLLVCVFNHFICNTYFCLSCILQQHASASRGHYQVRTLLLKLLRCRFSMSHMNALLLPILNSLKGNGIADSGTLHLAVRCGCCLMHGCVYR